MAELIGERLKMRMRKHSWTITHQVEQAKGCKNRKVNNAQLRDRPWLRGTCHVCLNYEPQTHTHHDSPIAYNFSHQMCIKETRQ